MLIKVDKLARVLMAHVISDGSCSDHYSCFLLNRSKTSNRATRVSAQLFRAGVAKYVRDVSGTIHNWALVRGSNVLDEVMLAASARPLVHVAKVIVHHQWVRHVIKNRGVNGGFDVSQQRVIDGRKEEDPTKTLCSTSLPVVLGER